MASFVSILALYMAQRGRVELPLRHFQCRMLPIHHLWMFGGIEGSWTPVSWSTAKYSAAELRPHLLLVREGGCAPPRAFALQLLKLERLLNSVTPAFGTGEGIRTLTGLLPGDFRSPMSASSITPACLGLILNLLLTPAISRAILAREMARFLAYQLCLGQILSSEMARF